MLGFTAYSPLTLSVFVRILRKGLTQVATLMDSADKNRIEAAKLKLREKLSFSYISSLPAYKNITQEQYLKLVAHIELLSVLLLETFINSNNLNNG